jgi:hypothetical protein
MEQLCGYKKCRLQKTPANYKTHRQSSTLHHTTPPQYISTVEHNQTENVIVENNKSIKNNIILKIRDISNTKTSRKNTENQHSTKTHPQAPTQCSATGLFAACRRRLRIQRKNPQLIHHIISYRYIDYSIWPDDLTNQRM